MEDKNGLFELRCPSALWDASLEVGFFDVHIGECDSLIFEFVDPGVGKWYFPSASLGPHATREVKGFKYINENIYLII
ncbi:hypothetical protein POVCU2_0001930 [Plasmodium ovale curtisi]|uniref:Uncharacterized protein n=1 Tax=Plasmodium ovale curtisi TaxID=864141 RepID=A0A1A8VK74_PLAOA|nr:hypothetical protein POVCU2_0001930 [Plasmodium ovale curtisi]SBT02787.1 hypothetical protein POVCU1_080750 [Plasmodium ovale curtisi]